jgi:hypothetical protein
LFVHPMTLANIHQLESLEVNNVKRSI